MPGAMAVYRADDRSILFASSTLVELMECDSLDDFMIYTKMSLDRIFPDSEKAAVRAAIDRQQKEPSNRHHFYFITANVLTKSGNLRPVEIRGTGATMPTMEMYSTSSFMKENRRNHEHTIL